MPERTSKDVRQGEWVFAVEPSLAWPLLAGDVSAAAVDLRGPLIASRPSPCPPEASGAGRGPARVSGRLKSGSGSRFLSQIAAALLVVTDLVKLSSVRV